MPSNLVNVPAVRMGDTVREEIEQVTDTFTRGAGVRRTDKIRVPYAAATRGRAAGPYATDARTEVEGVWTHLGGA